MKKIFVKVVLLAVVVTNYTVGGNDTLHGIAQKFCQSPNTIQVAEFREGIRELNYETIREGEVKPGMVLTIVEFK